MGTALFIIASFTLMPLIARWVFKTSLLHRKREKASEVMESLLTPQRVSLSIWAMNRKCLDEQDAIEARERVSQLLLNGGEFPGVRAATIKRILVEEFELSWVGSGSFPFTLQFMEWVGDHLQPTYLDAISMLSLKIPKSRVQLTLQEALEDRFPNRSKYSYGKAAFIPPNRARKIVFENQRVYLATRSNGFEPATWLAIAIVYGCTSLVVLLYLFEMLFYARNIFGLLIVLSIILGGVLGFRKIVHVFLPKASVGHRAKTIEQIALERGVDAAGVFSWAKQHELEPCLVIGDEVLFDSDHFQGIETLLRPANKPPEDISELLKPALETKDEDAETLLHVGVRIL